MGDATMEGNRWAEEIYWGHFQHVHFSQFLQSGFQIQLAIPQKFCDKLKRKLPDSVTLKGPGGGTWTVGVTHMDNALFFTRGWPEFVSDHPLAENDFLVFRYNGYTLFEVLMFDGESLCEKEMAYFVKKKCGSARPDQESSLNSEKQKEKTWDEINNALSMENSRDDMCAVTVSREQIIDLDPICEPKVRQKLPAVRAVTKDRVSDTKRSSNCDLQTVPTPKVRTPRRITSNELEARTPTSKTGNGPEFISNRRLVSEDEKAKAVQLAEEAASRSSKEALVVIMKPSHVYKRFFVLLSSEWVAKCIALENQDLYLRVGEGQWRTRFNYNRRRNCSGITSGWKRFSVDNNLDLFDACVFEIGSPVNDSVCLDVQIFRVVPEAIPLVSVATPGSGKRKKITEDELGEGEELEENLIV